MDVRLLGVTFALSCLVVCPRAALADGSGAGRGAAHSPGDRGGGRGSARRVDRQANGAPRRGTAVQSAPATPSRARPGLTDARMRARVPVVAIALPYPPDPNPRDSAEPDATAVRSTASAYSESSSIQPLRPSPLPQPSSSRGTLRLEIGPATAQVYVDGFYVGTVEDANRSQSGLSLAAGWHRLELRATGYVTPAINVTIEPNRTTSYRGELKPTRPAID